MQLFIAAFFFLLSTLKAPEVKEEKTMLPDSPTEFPSLYYEIQIAELNRKTELDLFFNEEVENYINLFLNERKEIFMGYLEKSKDYFPLFEKLLLEYNIPPEIKYLPVLESGLSPYAVSPSNAVGLWQFKEKTGLSFGLEINNYIDDRLDPELSTIAACRYLNHLNGEFKNWSLALLAYNAGPTFLRSVGKNLQGQKDYYQLYPFLPGATQKYLPALIAIIYLFNNSQIHFNI